MALQSHPFPDPTEAIACPSHKHTKLVKYQNYEAVQYVSLQICFFFIDNKNRLKHMQSIQMHY